MVSKPFIISLPFEDSPSKSTKFIKTLKGVKQWWSPRNQQHNEIDNRYEKNQSYTKEGIALTLTAPITVKNEIQTATILSSSNLLFKPHSIDLFTNNTVKPYNAQAFIHYDPTKNILVLGANSETHPTQSICLTLERYAWLIFQLQEEKYIESFLKACSLKPSFSSGPDQYVSSSSSSSSSYNNKNGSYLNSNPYCILQNPIIAIYNEKSNSNKPLSRRFTRLVRRKSNNNNQVSNQQQQQHQSSINNYNDNNNLFLFLLPKSLLLQAASYIPMTKPLPILHTTDNYKNDQNELPDVDLSKNSLIYLTQSIEEKTKQYIKSLTLSSHDLIAVNNQSEQHQHQLCCLICNRCGKKLNLETMPLSRPTSPSIQLSQHSQISTSSNITDHHDDKNNIINEEDEDNNNKNNNNSNNNSDDDDLNKIPSINIIKSTNNKKEIFNTTFNITYFQPIINTSTESTHLFNQSRPYSLTPAPIMLSPKHSDQASTFNTFPRRQLNNAGMHRDSLDHLSCTDSVSSSGAATASFSLPYYHQQHNTNHFHSNHHQQQHTHSNNFEAKGYIVIDHTQQEIHVVFPDLVLHSHRHKGLDPSFFNTVVWEEEDNSDEDKLDIKNNQQYNLSHLNQHHSRSRKLSKKMKLLRKNDHMNEKRNHSAFNFSSPTKMGSESTSKAWVLNGALIAWRRCELNVATLLMRIAQNVPQNYGVVFIGHGLGSAVAAISSLSLVSTGLLHHQSVTYCGIHPPRLGNEKFGEMLAAQHIETIRIMHPSDIMAHLPPRTSGLVHIGETTIIDEKNYMVQGKNPHRMEDDINRYLPINTFDMDHHNSAFGINLNPQQCSPSTMTLSVP